MYISRIVSKFAAVAALSSGLLFAGATAAQAGEVDNRVHHQQARIHAGERDGQLSHREASREERHLREIRAERNRDLRRHNGHLTPRERARINRQLNHNSREIHHDRHDYNNR